MTRRPQTKRLPHDTRLRDVVARFPKDASPAAASAMREEFAREHSFPDWASLEDFLEHPPEERRMTPARLAYRRATLTGDVDAVRSALDAHPSWATAHVAVTHRPLTAACEAGQLEVAKLLVARGADPREDGDAPAARASLQHLRVLRWLLDEHDVDPNAFVYGSYGPLLLFPCEYLALDCIRCLLEHGADANLVIPSADVQLTPLEVARTTYVDAESQAACLEALREAGAR